MKKIIAINDNLIAAIADYLKKEGSNKTAQPYLIVGESGSGKTFLLEKIKSLIQKEYGTQFIPAFIEGKTLFSTDDIWRCCEPLTGPMDSSDIFENIVSWQQNHLCRIVLLIDNIQTVIVFYQPVGFEYLTDYFIFLHGLSGDDLHFLTSYWR